MDIEDDTQERLVNWRKVTRFIAVVFGIVFGAYRLFAQGLLAIFTVTEREGWVGVVTVIAIAFTLLPLSILGINKPRRAAYGLFASTFISCIGICYEALVVKVDLGTRLDVVIVLVITLLPLLGTGAAFLISIGPNPPTESDSEALGPSC